jgi:hypothetical protein
VTYQFIFRAGVVVALALPVATPTLAAQQKCSATTPGEAMPLTYKGGPTVAAITACDLMTRLYIYSADSMRGREAGTPDAIRATAYIEREVKRLGLRPAGDNGTFFQYMPVTARVATKASSITVGGRTYHEGADFSAPGTADRTVSGEAIFGGTLGDTVGELSADAARGKIVVMMAAAGGGGGRGGFGGGRGGRGGAANNPLADAAAIVTVSPKVTTPRLQFILNDTVQNEGRAAYAAANPAPANADGRGGRGGRGGAGGGVLTVTVSPAVAAAILGKPAASAMRGDKGGSVTISRRRTWRNRHGASWRSCRGVIQS